MKDNANVVNQLDLSEVSVEDIEVIDDTIHNAVLKILSTLGYNGEIVDDVTNEYLMEVRNYITSTVCDNYKVTKM